MVMFIAASQSLFARVVYNFGPSPNEQYSACCSVRRYCTYQQQSAGTPMFVHRLHIPVI